MHCIGRLFHAQRWALPGQVLRLRAQSQAMSDTAHTLRQLLQQLEAEMRTASLWSAVPPSEQAMASTMPFMYDTLHIEEWLQWVFVPRLHALLDADAALPSSCSVQPLAEHEWTHRMPQGQHATVLELLAQIDATLTQSA